MTYKYEYADKICGIGTVYILRRERSREEIEIDVEKISKAGLKTLTIWPGLSWWDSEDGISPSCDSVLHLLDCAHKNGLGVILEIIGQNPGYELIPDYAVKDEYLTADQFGLAREINYNHPEVKKITAENLEFLVKSVKGAPALISYDIFNETYFNSKDKYTAELFREWLKNKYKDISTINRVWETTFNDFSQIDPARKYFSANMWATLAPGLDWQRFRRENLPGFIAEWIAIIKSLDPDRPVMADNGESSLFVGCNAGSDDWKLAEKADIFGTTYYPRSACGNHYMCETSHILNDRDHWSVECALHAVRCAAQGKPWVVSELQSHTKNALTPETRAEPIHLKIWLWQALAAGCQSITFWKWRPFKRGRQSSGRGLTLQNGEYSDRSRAVSEVADIYNKNETLFKGIVPREKEAAVLFSQDNKWLFENLQNKDKLYCKKSVMGWSKLLWEKSISIDYVRTDIAESFDLQNYKLVIAPCSMVLGEKQLAEIKRYVEAGGIFIADGRLAVMDEDNYVYDNIPGDSFSEWAGYVEEDIYPAAGGFSEVKYKNLTVKNRGVFSVALSGDKDGVVHAEFANGRPAVLSRKIGGGIFAYCAFDLGYSYFDGFDEGYSAVFNYLKEEFTFESTITVNDDAKYISRNFYRSGESLLVFLINYDGVEAETEFAILADDGYKSVNVISGEYPAVDFGKTGSVQISKRLASQEVCVFELKK
ncbi:MAG: beta-galactosidase [Planctomycetota bacterium]|jgi:beta-galactosidase